MSALKSLRSLALCLILLCPTLAEPKSNHDARQNESFACGTSPERQRDAIARAQYHESRIERLKSLQASRDFLAPQPYHAVQQDVGDVAVIEDDGTILVDPNPFDLNSRSFRFEPADSSTYRVVATNTAFDPTGGTPISLKDDDSTAITLQSPFNFYGNNYTSVQVNSDGNLTFGQSDTATTDRDIGRFISGPPRIGPLFTDLNREQGGIISYRFDPDGLLVVWNNVAEFSDSVPSVFDSFSVKLFQNGNIEFVYGTRVDNQNSVVDYEILIGISPGSSRGGIAAVDFTPPLPTGALAGTIVEAFASKLQLSETTVAKKFFQSHPDSFDHLNLFLGFSYDLGGNAYAYELNVKNEISGIGLDVFDDSTHYGSSHRLRSFLNMGTLTGFNRYPSDPNQIFLGTNSTLGIMGQESGHRWEAFTSFRDGATDSTAILGRDLAHWSFFFNSEGSVMEGNEILDRGANLGSTRFLTVSATDTYSHLDLYIMGLLTSDSVPPMFLVQNPFPSRSPASAPAVGVIFGGDRKDLTIDSIISANGPRVPSTYQASKVFRQGFIYLTRKGQAADPAEISKVQTIHDAWVKFFDQQTGQRGWIVTNLQDTPATTPARMLFPYFQGSSTRYTGIAVANWGPAPADVLFTAYDNSGNPLALPSKIINPRMMTIAPGAQIAVLAEQIFGLSLDDPRNGWIQAQSTSSQVSGFFLDGNISQTMLSGAVAGNQTNASLYFMRAQVSPASSPGNGYRNLINVVNPNASNANLLLKLFDQAGNVVTSAHRSLAPQARLSEDLPALFPGLSQPPVNGYLSLSSDNGVVGYQSIDTGSTIYSLPAVPASSSSLLYSAQFASGIAGNIRYYSDLNLINTGTQTRNIQVLLVGNDGNPVSGIKPVTLPPLGAGQQYRTRGETLFGLPNPATAANIVEGSLVITTDGPGLIGDLTFGDPVNFKFIASLPLDGNPVSNLVLSQVAEGSVGGEKPYFTGIAMYNPGTSDISVAIDVYSDQGAKTGSATLPLLRGNRISKTLPQLVSDIQTQRGGYIRLTATGGSIVAFELFGTQTLDFLAAVPPQPIVP